MASPADRPAPELVAADAIPLADVHGAFTAAFADYLIGPFNMPIEQFQSLFLARQAVELAASRCARRGSEILAFAFVAPRPEIGRWRLATMGAVPAARGSGAAPRLLDDFAARAKEAGMAEVELEVFAQNERAVRLYERHGYAVLHELHGYLAPPLGGAAVAPGGGVEAASRDAAFAWIETQARPRVANLPLQVTPAALAASTSALQAWRRGTAQLVFSELDANTVAIASLIDGQPAQRDARALAEALRRAYPERQIRVPQLQRIDIGGQALRDAGFAVQPLHQLLMRCTL